jgi:hypothetical protein
MYYYPDWGFSVRFPQLKGKRQGKSRKDGARPAIFLIFVLLYVLFVCICVLYYCHRVATQLQLTNILYNIISCRSQWPRGLRRRSAAARQLRLWVWIPPGAWRFVCCECCVLSGRGLCDELITRPEESYRLWCFVVCYLEISWLRKPWQIGGRWTRAK